MQLQKAIAAGEEGSRTAEASLKAGIMSAQQHRVTDLE